MTRNPGYLPAAAIGRRVRVVLAGDAPGTPPREWAADGKGGCRWTRTASPLDIDQFEVIG